MRRNITLLTCTVAFIISCSREKEKAPIDQLPPITQTGANTFGCLVDGKVFKPRKKILDPKDPLQCYYQFYNNKVVFSLSARDAIDGLTVIMGGNNFYIHRDTTMRFSYPGENQFAGGYGAGKKDEFGYEYTTYESLPGEFNIQKFDTINQIISGTFWFDALDTSTGKTVKIRDGRFDVQFTR